MQKSILAVLASAALLTQAHAIEYKVVAGWPTLPEGRVGLGNQHGDVAVSSNGDVYVSIMDTKSVEKTTDGAAPSGGPGPGLQVYSNDGKYLRNVPGAPNDLHGFVIHKEKDGEFIYGPRLIGQTILKMTLDGKVMLEIPASAIPDEFKGKDKKTGKSVLHMTAMDVAPNGDLYVTDGYGSDYVYQFDSTGKYIKAFGGKGEPYNFKTLHKIAIDTRFTPPRIIGCDRANDRVIHMSLDGEFLGVVAKDLKMPAAIAIHGDNAVVGEIKGRITILDKAGNIATQFGSNTTEGEFGTPKTPPDKWRPGIVTAPHGVAYNAHGDVFVSEYNNFGRVHRFNLQ